jgi:hypothetical protein
MSIARRYHSATLLPNGKVLIAGSLDFGPAGPQLLDRAELYAAVGLVIRPSRGHVRQSISVLGTGFHPMDTITLYWDTTQARPLLSMMSTTTGSFVARLTVPRATPGTHSIIVVDQASGLPVTASFHVQPNQAS